MGIRSIDGRGGFDHWDLSSLFHIVALINPLVRKLRNTPSFSTFLDAVNVASVTIIVAICYVMGRESITDWRTLLIGISRIILTFSSRKVNSALVVLGGALLGYLLSILPGFELL